MTTVLFKLRQLDGTPIANTWFRVEAGYSDSIVNPSTVLPAPMTFLTDASGNASVTLPALDTPYFISQANGSAGSPSAYKFFVPQSETPLPAEMLYVDLSTTMRLKNDASIGALIDAKVAAINAANQAMLAAKATGAISIAQLENLANEAQAATAAAQMAATNAAQALASTTQIQVNLANALNNYYTVTQVDAKLAPMLTQLSGLASAPADISALKAWQQANANLPGDVSALKTWRNNAFRGNGAYANGWHQLGEDGLILQWGVALTDINGTAIVSFPISFSQVLLSVTLGLLAGSPWPVSPGWTALDNSGSRSGIAVYAAFSNGQPEQAQIRYMALGY